MEKREYLFQKERPSKALLKFCVPAAIGMVINTLFNFVDALFIAQLGTEQMAAAAVTFPITMFFIGVGMIFGTGGGSYISRLIGMKQPDEAEKTSGASIYMSLIVTVFLTVFFLLTLDPFLKLLGADQNIISYAKDYTTPYLLGSVFVVLNVTFSNLVRSQGSILFSMIAMILGCGLNIILDPLFIFTFNLGIQGAAIATVISRIVAVTLFLWYYLSGKSLVKAGFTQFKPSAKILGQIFKIGIPGFMFQLLTTVSTAIINILASGYSTDAVAGMGITLRIMAIATFIVFGYAKGYQPIAGYNYGAGLFNRLKKLTNLSLVHTTIICLILTAVNIVFSKPIIRLFTQDINVFLIAKEALFAYSSVLPFFGIQIILGALFLATGKGKEGGFLSMARQGFYFIPLAFLLTTVFGLTGLYWIQPLSDLLTVATAIPLMIIFYRRLSEKQPDLNEE